VIVVHSMQADGYPRPQHFYFADDETGVCGPLRGDRLDAVLDAQRHAAHKRAVAEATKDERR
jgi:hypothetical protein